MLATPAACLLVPVWFKQNSGVDVDRLRAETRAEHESVETLLPLTGPGLTREIYGDILICLYSIVRTWEEWAAAHAPANLAEMLRERRRTPLLEADLKFLKKEARFESRRAELASILSRPVNEASFLGAMYVMEGSTLGGQYIARHVEEVLGLEAGPGDAYFRGYGANTGAMWQSFKSLLRDLPEEHSSEAIAAAKGMFGYFEHAIRTCPAAGLLREATVEPNS
jgi:heme oxygenase